MPSTLVATAGATNANAYCTVVEADAYVDNLPRADVRIVWTAATTDDKTRALITATTLLDRAFQFLGSRTSLFQPLEWPRYFYNPSYGWGSGSGYGYSYSNGSFGYFLIDSTTVPARVKDATAEYARQLLERDRTADPTTPEDSQIQRIKADVIEIEYNRDGVTGKPVPDAVALLLAGLGYLFGAQHSVPLVRV